MYLKMLRVSCTNTRHDVSDLVNHGIVKMKNMKILRIIFQRDKKKNFNLRFKLGILRSYHFVAEITFNLIFLIFCLVLFL